MSTPELVVPDAGLAGLLAAGAEVLTLIENQRLFGRGIGWVDLQLLASALAGGVRLWSRDRRTGAAAVELGLAHAMV